MSAPRIACLFVPDFRLQVALAGLGGEPEGGLALVDPEDGRRLIVAASPSARLDGVRRGMTSVAATSLAPELVVREVDRAALAAIHQEFETAVRALCPVFESAGDGVMYALFDGLETRYGEDGAGGFLDDLREVAEDLDLPARVGLASTRFASRAAAVMEGRLPAFGVAAITVPPGEEAAFLAPLPSQLLPGAADVIETLGQLGVRTLGAFAALPRQGVARRWGTRGTALHRLARGEDRCTLVPTREPKAFEVLVHSEYPITQTEALRFLLKQPLERLIGALDGQGLAARALAWELNIEGSETVHRTTHAASPSASLGLWSDLIAVGLEGLALQGGVQSVRLEAVGVGPRPASQERLTGPKSAPPGARSVTLAHLAAELGPEGYGAQQPAPSVWPERRQAAVGASPTGKSARGAAAAKRQQKLLQKGELWVPDRCPEGGLTPALRRVHPAEPIDVETRGGRPSRFRHRGGWFRVDRTHGPWDVSAEWWDARGERARRTFQVEGPSGVARIHWERTAVSEGWFLGAWLD
ncbi:MAG: DNA polymerase Y family protein [Deltaproteobacteria bacterium]|nr:DNA polymerase Y family protein [Deltaproteobacteria bacterium]